MRLLEPVREQPAGETPRDPEERRRPHDDGAPPQRLTWRRAKNRMISGNPNAASTTLSHSLRSRSLISPGRSEEHTSELQSRPHLVCRLLLEKKKKNAQ